MISLLGMTPEYQLEKQPSGGAPQQGALPCGWSATVMKILEKYQ